MRMYSYIQSEREGGWGRDERERGDLLTMSMSVYAEKNTVALNVPEFFFSNSIKYIRTENHYNIKI